MRLVLLCLLMLLPFGSLDAQIIPTPRSDTPAPGRFVLDDTTVLSYADELAPLAGYLLQYLPLTSGRNVSPTRRCIALSLDDTLPAEGYRLTIREERIELAGGTGGGAFYAVQSLLQLLPAEVYAGRCPLPVELDCRTIADAPAYAYRGMHLDVARTWMEGERLKRMIDLLAYHKINKLHLHLADDEGWRIEILSHPELAAIGGFRGGDSPVAPVYGKWGEKYGGYYTQAEMREIIRYAARRNIEIIPEIDLPGHSRTVARIHPEILCRYTPDTTPTGGYDTRSAWCVAREENYALLEDILDEICRLFPSELIHIGGDEVDRSQWERCPDCRALMRERRMGSTARLQDYFTNRLAEMLVRRGKRPAVWNETVADGTFTRDCAVYGWESVKACRQAAAQGYPTVVMPGQYFYFDMRQSAEEEGHNWAAIFDAGKPYGFDLSKQGFTPAEQSHVLGFEGAFWSELYVSHEPETTDYIDFMLFPRICSLAELCWHSGPKEWPAFKKRLYDSHFDRLNAMKVGYRLFPPAVSYADGRLTVQAPADEEVFCVEEPSGEEFRFTGPVYTTSPERYRFRTRRGTGRSPWVAVPAYYRTITPAVRFSSSFSGSTRAPFERLEQYRGAAWTTRTCRRGDWMLFTFEQPVRCREIHLQTGFFHLPKAILNSGTVEISYDGETFLPAGELTAGACRLHPDRPVRAIRVTSGCDGNGDPRVIIQPLRIKP